MFLLFCMYFFLAAPKLPGKTPQPPTEFFMGNFTELDKNWDILQDWLLEKTKLFKWKTWGVSAPRLGSFSGYGAGVVISSPENVQHLLKDKFKRYEKTDVLTNPILSRVINALPLPSSEPRFCSTSARTATPNLAKPE